MQPSELKSYFRKQIESVRDDYIRDLEAMPDEQLASAPGGSARSPYDLTFEVAHVNRRLAKRMRGEDPGPWGFEGWVKAPAEFKNRQKAIDAVRDSMNEVLASWESVPESEVNREIKIPSGMTSPVDLAFMCAYHTGYHDAQLNYLQTLHGDDKTHWASE